jgi:hypothetical protein
MPIQNGTNMHKIFRIAMTAAMLAACAGCVGTSALRISTVPPDAKVYANGRLVGQSPTNIPVHWGYYILYSHCDKTLVRIEKDGYQTLETLVTRATLGHRNRSGNYTPESEFGKGRTYPFVFQLHPEKK